MRPAPKLIYPNLLNKVNEVYIAKTQQSNSILLWLFNTIGYYFKQNILFSTVVVGLILFLLYRYIENIKKKNKILKNLNSDKPIEIKLEVPIDYNNKPQPKQSNQSQPNQNQNKGDVLSEISINLKQEFDKDLENDLKLMNDPDEVRIPQNNQQINPMVDRMPSIDPKMDPNQTQYRSTNPDKPFNVNASNLNEENINEEVNYVVNVLQKSNVPQVQSKCGVIRQEQQGQQEKQGQPTCGFKPKKNAYLETSDKSEKPSNKKRDKSKKSKRKHKKSKRSKRSKSKKNKKSKKSKRSREPRRDRHEEEIMNIFEREMAITHGSISRERSNKESKFKPSFIEDQNIYEGPIALNTFSDNFQVFE